MDIYSLERFVEAQEHMYKIALSEIKNGRKISHWMWYIFPQLRGLGHSTMSHFFGIADLEEARRYLSHPILSERLVEISEALLSQEKTDPTDILGPVDAAKLRSSMTLFSLISPQNSVFHQVLKKFYKGKPDAQTQALVKKHHTRQ